MSDLHLTEEEFAGGVADEHLAAFVDRMASLSTGGQPVTLVFVGDILELLRSRRWSELWNVHQSAPWSGMCRDFRNFPGGHAERCALAVASGIRDRYAGFAQRLRSCVEAGTIRTKYVFGNHDYMVQLSPELRAIVVELLSLDHDPARRFMLTYDDKASSIMATHGHSYDAINWHREEEGYWALGDVVVLRVVNRFAEEAGAALGLSETTHVGRLVQDIENIESLIDIPLYVNWIAENFMTSPADKEVFRGTWKRIIDDFLAIEAFDGRPGYRELPFQRLRQGFDLSTRLGLAELFRRFAGLFGTGGPDYAAEAKRLGETRDRRVVLFGHTHEPTFLPLGLRADGPSFYINSGCWRRLVSRASSGQPGPFVPRRVASYVLVDPVGGDPLRERYHLHQEWHGI